MSPAKLAEKRYADLVTALKNHHQPEPPHVLQHALFVKRDRKQNESVQEYIAELQPEACRRAL